MSKDKKEVYISVDIESDGPLPGPNSMLSFGAAAFIDGQLMHTFTRNLAQLTFASPDPKTKAEFWDKNPEAWEACRKDIVDPSVAMHDFVYWVENIPHTPVFVGYPATFDFMFVYYYMMHFVGRSPFSFSALDIKSYAMAKLGTGFRETTKRNMPKEWFKFDGKHTHVALDDAIEQGKLFMNILKWEKKV